MAEFYKMNPADWNIGTDDLSLEQEAAYLRVINAINLHDQPIRNNPRVLCGLWRCNERKAKRLLAELVEAGKLVIEGGVICNERALNDVSIRRQLRVDRASTGRLGGIESGKARRKSLENNETGEALGLTREEKRREEKKEEKREPNGSPKKTPASVLAPLLGSDLAAAVVEHRQRIKAPLTERAADGLLKEFERATDPIAGAEEMLARGWRGFKAEWMNGGGYGRDHKTGREQAAERRLEGVFAAAQHLDGERR